MTEYNKDLEARMMAFEARISFNEERLAALERRAWTEIEAKAKKPKRELTEEQKSEIRARLVAGQENARLKREAEAKATGKDKKEVANGASTAEN